MEKYISVMKQSIELLNTVQEGLEHVQALLKEGKFEESIPLFGDIVLGFSTTERTVVRLPEEILYEEVKTFTIKVRKALDLVVGTYETKNYYKMQEILQFTLLPRFKRWKDLLEEMFSSYLAS